MIAKGNLHAHGVNLAAYLITGKDGERAELVELRGFVADNIRDAFIDVQIQAEATHAEKPFFHAYVRLPADETLTREQWQETADRIEKRLGFEGQGRAVAFHYKHDGETHMHVAWSRIDLETMKAIDPGLYKNKLKELSRDLEKEFGITLVANERASEDKTKAAGRNEFEQARRLGTDLKDIRNTIHECWQSADSGKAFAASLDQQGLILARGDKRDFVIIDRDGGDHALSKRITGATAAETRARLVDIDRTALPSVEQAKANQRERQSVPDLAQGLPAAPEIPAPEPAAPVITTTVVAREVHTEQTHTETHAPRHGLHTSEEFSLVGSMFGHIIGSAVMDFISDHIVEQVGQELGPEAGEIAEQVADAVHTVSEVKETLEIIHEVVETKTHRGPKEDELRVNVGSQAVKLVEHVATQTTSEPPRKTASGEAKEAKVESDRSRLLREYRDRHNADELEAEARKRYEESRQHDYGGRERER